MTPLYDSFGRPIPENPEVPLEPRVVTRVSDIYTWHRLAGLTPQRLLRILRIADTGYTYELALLAKEIEQKDAELSSAVNTRRLAVLGLPWEILPASDSPEDEEIAAFIREQFKASAIRRLLTDLMDNVITGFAGVWMHWHAGPPTVVTHFEEVPGRRFTFQELHSTYEAPALRYPRLLTLANPSRGEDIPPYSMVYHEHQARSGLPQDRGLVRTLAFLFVLKNYALKDWGVYTENFATPRRIGKYPRYAGPDAIDKLEKGLLRLAGDSVAIIPEEMVIEVLEARSASTGEHSIHERLVKYVDHAYQHAILGQEASTEGTPGKLGADLEQGKVRFDILKSDSEALSDTISDQVVRPLVGFNYGFDRPMPEFRLIAREPVDLLQLAQFIETASHSLPIPTAWAYERMQIPMPKADEETFGGGMMGMERMMDNEEE